VEGERYHAKLRGDVLPPLPTHRSSVGHSHVLPPELRNDAAALAVLYRLLHKAATRLRHYGYYAGGMGVHLRYRDDTRFQQHTRFAPHGDTLKFNATLAALWAQRPAGCGGPAKIGVTLFDLAEEKCIARDLFDTEIQHEGLNIAVDQINQRFGNNAIYYGSAHNGRGAAPMRIAFNHIPELRLESDA
jgi:DNA polymerase-4